MKKNYKIVAMLLLIINFITCFIPGYFYEQVWKYEWPGSTQIAKYGCTMFDVNTDVFSHSGPAYIFACFVVICWVVCIAVILYSIVRSKDHKLISFAPCFCFVPFITFIIYMNSATYYWDNSKGYTNYSVNWLFYISLALQISAAALMVIAMTAKEDLPLTFHRSSQRISQAEELSKYKELLDNGAITQEEYDKKKKQLLEL